jgi:hypothetical protein
MWWTLVTFLLYTGNAGNATSTVTLHGFKNLQQCQQAGERIRRDIAWKAGAYYFYSCVEKGE